MFYYSKNNENERQGEFNMYEKLKALSIEEVLLIMGIESEWTRRQRVVKVVIDECEPITESIYLSAVFNKGLLIETVKGLVYSYLSNDYEINKRGNDLILTNVHTRSSAVVYCGDCDKILYPTPGLKLEEDDHNGYPALLINDGIYSKTTYLKVKLHLIIYGVSRGYKILRAIGYDDDRTDTVHHMDGNKINNSINNLEMMLTKDHNAYHGEERSKKGKGDLDNKDS